VEIIDWKNFFIVRHYRLAAAIILNVHYMNTAKNSNSTLC